MKRILGNSDIALHRSPLFRRLRCEPLEDRRMLSVLFVDDDAANGGDGLAWASAYSDLQSALENAAVVNSDGGSENDVDQIWIAEGTYKPSAELEPGDLRSASFSLVDGVALYGGFSGTEITLGERDWAAYQTILSGDLGVTDDASDNAYTVVYCGVGVESALDGVTVAGGNANGSYVSGHSERQDGGGIYNPGTLTVTNSTVSGNSGGGICNYGELTVTNGMFLGNSGGGIYNDWSELTVTNSMFLGNSGGGIYNTGGATVANSVFSGNSASEGGGIANYCWLELTNSTVAGNRGGGVYVSSNSQDTTIENSIVAGNSYGDDVRIPPPPANFREILSIFHSLIGYSSGAVAFDGRNGSRVGIDPLFVRNPDPGPDGSWGTSDDDYGDLRLQLGSPAVDAGDNSLLPTDAFDLDGDGNIAETIPFDIDGVPRIDSAVVDMGAYEGSFYRAVLYVDADAPAGGDGSCWASAYNDLQSALDHTAALNSDAYSANDVDQIWIADGTYQPTVRVEPTDPRSASFRLLNGVTLVGGFAGTESTFTDRDPSTHQTILSGDIGVEGLGSDNAYTVVRCADDVESALYGISIAGGNADGEPDPSDPTKTDGGGIYNDGDLALTNVRLYANSGVRGGAICNAGTLDIANCSLLGNSADRGGGVYNATGTLTVTNSTLTGNSVSEAGGGLYTAGTSTVNNSIIAENTTSSSGPNVYDETGMLSGSHNLIGDGLGQTVFIHGEDGNLVGTTATPLDPGFVRSPSDGGDGWGDDPLTPEVDESANDDYGDLHLRVDSLAIGVGDNLLLPQDALDRNENGNTTEPIPFDLGGYPRVQRNNVDMGAYERTSVLFVNANAPSGGTALRWDVALNDLQDALVLADSLNSDARLGNDITQIWIAEGTYLPSAELEPGVPRSATFSLLDGVALYGGFRGAEGTPLARDLATHETILSGDLGIIGDRSDNAFSVVYCGAGIESRIDGIVITGGNADMEGSGHLERRYGGGVYSKGTLAITRSTVLKNAAIAGGGICTLAGHLTLTNCMVLGNTAAFDGGGIYNEAELTIVNTAFAGNSADEDGGAICNQDTGVLTVINATLAGNSAESRGGGIFNSGDSSTATLHNTIVEFNTATVGADVSDDPGTLSGSHNTIGAFFYPDLFVQRPDDGGDGWGDDPETPHIDESANDAYGDLRLDPYGLDTQELADEGDNTVLPEDQFDLDGDGNMIEPIQFDLAGNDRVHGWVPLGLRRVDIGAYELDGYCPWDPVFLIGDLNEDGYVGSEDLDIIRSNWGQMVPPGTRSMGDENGDGCVDSADLDMVRANWGAYEYVWWKAASVSLSNSPETDGEDSPKAAATDAVFGGTRSLAEVNWLRAVDSLNQGYREPAGPRQRITLDLRWLDTMYKHPD